LEELPLLLESLFCAVVVGRELAIVAPVLGDVCQTVFVVNVLLDNLNKIILQIVIHILFRKSWYFYLVKSDRYLEVNRVIKTPSKSDCLQRLLGGGLLFGTGVSSPIPPPMHPCLPQQERRVHPLQKHCPGNS
jgi:hypothetical protein